MEQYNVFKTLYTGKDLTDSYAKYRPTFPESFYDTIHTFCQETGSGNDLAVDVGCGPGLSSRPLVKYYQQVIGVDVSQSQISNAPTNIPGLSFRVGTAEDLSFLPSSSVDLVTAGVSLHWLQLDKFYPELDRVLKQGGSFVAYTHDMFYADNHEELNDFLFHIFSRVLKQYWTAGMRDISQDRYTTMTSPYRDHIRNNDIIVEKYWTVEQLLGFMKSWSGIEKYAIANPGVDLIGEIRDKLYDLYSTESGDINKRAYRFTSPIYTIMAHKPGGFGNK